MATVETPAAYKTEGTPDTAPAAPVYVPETWSGTEAEPRGSGWIGFAAIMMGLAGIWAIFEGILAVSSSKIYAANATYVFSDLRTWGWIVIGLGIAALFAAGGIMTGSQVARWFAIAVAAVNAGGQLMFVHANTWWTMTVVAVDILVIYALAVYGGKRQKA
jgi:hypothetical protein